MDPFKKKDPQVEADELQDIIRDTLNKKKKPVKFTWKGLANLSTSLFSTNPFDKLKLDRLQQLTGGAKEKEQDYIDFFEDIEKGVTGGLQDLGYAIGDLLTSGIDAAADTDLSEKLTEVYEENKIEDPETLTGLVTKVLTQYGIPGGASFKILNRFKIFQRNRKLAETGTKFQKGTQIAKRVGYMSTALAATDFIASAPDRENLFIEEEKTEGLQGRDLALARIRNRVRFGGEGALFGLGFTLMGKPMALGFKYGIFKPGAKVAGIGLKAVDKAVVSPITYLGSKAITPTVGQKLRNASAYTIDKALAPLKVTAVVVPDLIIKLPDVFVALPNVVPPSLKNTSPPSASNIISAPPSIVKSPLSDIVLPFIVISSTVKVVRVPTDVRLGIAVISSSKYAAKSVTATCTIVPLSFNTTLSASATVVDVAEVSPSTMFNSAAVEAIAVPL